MTYGKLAAAAGGAYALSAGGSVSIAGASSVNPTGISINQRLHVGFYNCVCPGAALLDFRFGGASGIASTGYQTNYVAKDAPVSLRRFFAAFTDRFRCPIGAANRTVNGIFTLSLNDEATFTYAGAGILAQTFTPQQIMQVQGWLVLGEELSQFQVFTSDGSNMTSGTIFWLTE